MNVYSPGQTLFWMESSRHKGSRDLVQLLYHLRQSQSRNPEDKVYGDLGLASVGRSMVPQVDYALPVEKVYARLYQIVSEARENLD